MSALVLTLTCDTASRARVLTALASDPRLSLGQRVLDRLPVVAETPSCADGEALHDELAAIEGVLKVDVVAVELSEVV